MSWLPSDWATAILATAPAAATKRVDFQLAILLNPGTIFIYGWGIKDANTKRPFVSINLQLLSATQSKLIYSKFN